MKYDRKPPLAAKSSINLRPRRSLRSNSASLQTPPGSLTKSQKPIRTRGMEESEIRPEYRSISCELRALARMVKDELGNEGKEKAGVDEESILNPNKCCTVLERGRLYDEYSARRNERLKRKKGEMENRYNPRVTVESSKRRGPSKKIESVTPPRYLLRSVNKENKKRPVAASVTGTRKKMATRRIGKV